MRAMSKEARLQGRDQLMHVVEKEYLAMQVAGQMLAVPVDIVRDVIKGVNVTRVPLAAPEIQGCLNLRGRIVTAINMRTRLGSEPFADLKKAMNVVVESRHELFSIIVDKVGDVMSLPVDDVEDTPANIDKSWQSLSMGIYRLQSNLMVLLDIQNLLQKN